MTHVALLRGINVGGNRPVKMAKLREVMEALGHEQVRTYINSGNVIFNSKGAKDPTKAIATGIAKEFGFPVEVLVKDLKAIEKVEQTIPDDWVDDKTMRTYVMFLWDEFDKPDIMDDLPIREDMDNVIYVEGAIIWQVERKYVTKSGMNKVVSGPLYKAMTIRNANTVRKIASMMREAAAAAATAAG
jgi:uncharacterized protein (DUF1697 family)